MAPSSQSNNQKSIKLQSNASVNNQLQHQSRTCHYGPTHPDHLMQPPAPFTPISTQLQRV